MTEEKKQLRVIERWKETELGAWERTSESGSGNSWEVDVDVDAGELEVDVDGGWGYNSFFAGMYMPLEVLAHLMRRAGWTVEPPAAEAAPQEDV